MKRALALFPALASAAAMAAAPVPTASPPAGGTISIEPKTANGDYDPALGAFGDAAGEALGARGFTLLADDGHAAYVAVMILNREEVGTGLAKGGKGSAAVQPGLSQGAGVGIAIPFSNGKSQLVPIVRTRLDIGIRKRGETRMVWHAAAVTVREGTAANGSAPAVAADLTRAALASYPAEPRDVVGVP